MHGNLPVFCPTPQANYFSLLGWTGRNALGLREELDFRRMAKQYRLRLFDRKQPRSRDATFHEIVYLRVRHRFENDAAAELVYTTHKGPEIILAVCDARLTLHHSNQASCERWTTGRQAALDEVTPYVGLFEDDAEGR